LRSTFVRKRVHVELVRDCSKQELVSISRYSNMLFLCACDRWLWGYCEVRFINFKRK